MQVKRVLYGCHSYGDTKKREIKKMSNNEKVPQIILPQVFINSDDILNNLTSAIGVNRDLLPSKDSIDNVLQQLPALLNKIRPGLRDEKIVKMCIASGIGLFDSAINYVWNQTIIEIRKRIIVFGVDVISQIKNKKYEEKDIDELQDSTLLGLAHELNLISDEGFYFLSQCRDMRNNFSAAHPSLGEIDNYELINYINRCVKYSLSHENFTIGVNIKEFISLLKDAPFTEDRLDFWVQKINSTYQAQKDSIIIMLHSFYCDPQKQSVERGNVLKLSQKLRSFYSPKAISGIIDQYEEYIGKDNQIKIKASEDFMVRNNLMEILKNPTRHSIISKACKQMLIVHQNMNNFYNEPPFAEYLLQVSKQSQIPDSIKDEFVETIVSCAIGNAYGVSRAAEPYYNQIIQNFSPKEMQIMLNLPDKDGWTSYKIKNFHSCKNNYKEKLQLLDQNLMTPQMKTIYDLREK
jgi:hypothetical protein